MKPNRRWEQFHAYGNGDGTFHILVIDANGGYVFVDRIASEQAAGRVAAALNAMLRQAKAA